jgi:WD40 repeat protein
MKAPSDELIRETLRFGPNGILIARLPGENSILVFDVLTGNRRSLQHSSTITYLTLSPDGARLLTSTSDGTLWLWDTNTGNLLTQQKYDFRVLLLRISADGRTAVAFSDNWVHVFDITKDSLQYADGQLMAIRALGILRDASGRNLRKIWEMSPGKFEISDIAIPPKPNPATSAPTQSDVTEWQNKLSLKFDENGQLRSN